MRKKGLERDCGTGQIRGNEIRDTEDELTEALST